jgi:hypothetical protein
MQRLALTLMVAEATTLGVSAFAPSGVTVAYPPARTTREQSQRAQRRT